MSKTYDSKPHKPIRGEVKLQFVDRWNSELQVHLGLNRF